MDPASAGPADQWLGHYQAAAYPLLILLSSFCSCNRVQVLSIHHKPTAEQPHVFVDFEDRGEALAVLQQGAAVPFAVSGRPVMVSPVDAQFFHRPPPGASSSAVRPALSESSATSTTTVMQCSRCCQAWQQL